MNPSEFYALDDHKREDIAFRNGRAVVQRIVNRMCKDGYPVELTHKNGYKPNEIDVSHYGNWGECFEENVASALVNGWESKSALINLVRAVREER